MSTAYNLRHQLDLAAQARLHEVNDPGSGGVISLRDADLVTVNLTSAGARTLVAASGVSVGTTILVTSVAAASVNSVSVGAGESVRFTVILDSSGDRVWQAEPLTPYVLTTHTIPSTPDEQDAVDAILSLVADLAAAGLVDATGFTQAT